MSNQGYSRRRFIGVCSTTAALLGAAARSGNTSPKPDVPLTDYPQARLVNSNGQPLTAEALALEQEYLFFYPYPCTPCFLLNLGKPAPATELETADGNRYRWDGGVGPQQSIVAFAAICSHKLTYPSEPVSFIGYRQQPVGFLNADRKVERKAAVIQCCSEHSIYDPAQGAKVLAGPAPHPLATIKLEQDQDGTLMANGVFGATVYERFFDKFGFQLEMQFGKNLRQPVTGNVTVMAVEDYTRQRIQC